MPGTKRPRPPKDTPFDWKDFCLRLDFYLSICIAKGMIDSRNGEYMHSELRYDGYEHMRNLMKNPSVEDICGRIKSEMDDMDPGDEYHVAMFPYGLWPERYPPYKPDEKTPECASESCSQNASTHLDCRCYSCGVAALCEKCLDADCYTLCDSCDRDFDEEYHIEKPSWWSTQ